MPIENKPKGNNPFAKYKNAFETSIIYDGDDLLTLYDGSSARYKDCIKLANGRYALSTDKRIVKEYLTNRLVAMNDCKTIINSFKNNEPDKTDIVYVHYDSKDYSANLYNKNLKNFQVTFESIPTESYIEDFNTGVFYHKDTPRNQYLGNGEPIMYRKVRNSDFVPTGDLKRDYLLGLRSPTFRLTEGKKYTFGVELETIKGFLPNYLDAYLNYDAVHDGSLREDGKEPVGGEYVTGVLVGDMGFAQLKRLTIELTNRCKVNKLCGLHVHLGNFNFTKENLVLLYKAYFLLENEIFSMLPVARANNEYCRRLPKLNVCLKELKLCDITDIYSRNQYVDNSYLELFKFVSSKDVLPGYDFNKSSEHPLGKKCGYNHKTSRYCWLNFVPAMFNTRGDDTIKTLEIRNHSGTTNYRKTRNWVLIHMAILSYVENYTNEIFMRRELSLSEIIIKTFPKRSSILLAYIEERKQTFKNKNKAEALNAELNDYIEVNEDKLLTLKAL